MSIDKYLEGIDQTYKDLLKGGKSRETGFPFGDILDTVKEYLKDLYESDDSFKLLVETEHLDSILQYIRLINYRLNEDYGYVMRVFDEYIKYDNYFGRIPNYNKVLQLFMEHSNYADGKTYKEFIESRNLTEERAKVDPYASEFRNWDNLFKNYYPSIVNGDFSGLRKLNRDLNVLPYVEYMVKHDYENPFKAARERQHDFSCR